MGEYAARRASARLPISAEVRVRYPGVDEVFDEIVGDVGLAGMFVATASPMPAGTLMHFELRPSPQWRPLRGRARVVWARHRAGGENRPTGMGVRFIELDERARRGVRWLIETYQAVGDKPFDTWTIPQQFARSGAAADADAHATQEVEPLGPPLAETARGMPPWPWLAAALAVLLGLGWLLRGASGPEPEAVASARVATPPATAGGAEAAARAAPAEPVPAPQAAPVTAPAEPVTAPAEPVTAPARPAAVAPLEQVLGQLAQEWAAAWSSQDPERYLAFYAADFVPEGAVNRRAWERARRQRLAAPAFVRVRIENVQALELETATPRTVFTQTYESDTFGDQVTKSLTWTRDDGSWRIVSERSAP
ncbi:MAG: PilZ domain-containing protein [Acidobacteriota bacterium]|nr:PilZ domain-containing protein [Acidobacteriota bacterium]MDH3522371.1 PilZ domain-containing protein [Acidobacteriota bacterium]